MVVKLLVSQVPTFWETIKFCATVADEIDEKYLQSYLNKLLQALLSDKAQCFIKLDADRTFVSMMITKVRYDKVTDERNLHIQCLYSFNKVHHSEWIEDFVIVKRFAKNLECSSITFDTRNERVVKLGLLVNFKEIRRSFAWTEV